MIFLRNFKVSNTLRPIKIQMVDFSEARAALVGREFIRPAPWRTLFGWCLFIGCGILLLSLHKPEEPSNNNFIGSDLRFGLVLIGGGLASFVFIWFFIFRQIRLRSQGLGRPTTIEVLHDSVCFSTDGIRREFGWSCFDGFFETENLFVLQQPEGLIRVIPKSAFSTDEERHLGKLLMQTNLPKISLPKQE
jgi:hypothetical protein